jgi:hypothetical protein
VGEVKLKVAYVHDNLIAINVFHDGLNQFIEQLMPSYFFDIEEEIYKSTSIRFYVISNSFNLNGE